MHGHQGGRRQRRCERRLGQGPGATVWKLDRKKTFEGLSQMTIGAYQCDLEENQCISSLPRHLFGELGWTLRLRPVTKAKLMCVCM